MDKVLAAFGNMPGEMIDYGAKALKPVENYIGNYLKLWDNIENPQVVESLAGHEHLGDGQHPDGGRRVPAAHRRFLPQQPPDEGELMIRGERVDLSR